MEDVKDQKKNLISITMKSLLCFVGSFNSEYCSIHVILNYNLRIYFVFAVSFVVSIILSVLVHVLVFVCWKFVCTKNICNSCIHRNNNIEQHELSSPVNL